MEACFFYTDINIETAKHTVELLATPTIQTPNSESTVGTRKQLRRRDSNRRTFLVLMGWHKNNSQLTFLEKRNRKWTLAIIRHHVLLVSFHV